MANSKLSADNAVLAVINPQSANNQTLSSGYVAMAGREKVMFVLSVGATDTTVDAKVKEAKDGSGTSIQDLTGKAITQYLSTDDNKQAIIEVDASELSDTYTHLRFDVTVGNATAALVSMVAVGAHSRYQPASGSNLTTVKEIVA